MADVLDATGLTVKTLTELTQDLITGFQSAYGADINVDQNSPDGQVIGIEAQAGIDIRELLVQINAGFDPDQAVGTILDQRCAINGIARIGGTYTIIPVDITVSKTVSLQGLDANFNLSTGTGFTVTDGNGNNFILIDSVVLTAGLTTVSFRAQNIGAVLVTINTVTSPVTIISGVTTINNSSAATTIGDDEETDAQFRTRRQRSVALTSIGYLNGLNASLLALTGVTASQVIENYTDAVDAYGIPAHGIWAIVAGGANSDIASLIYNKKSAGCNMKGSVVVNETNSNGLIVPIKFDRPIAENLYLRFDIKQTVAAFSFDSAAIKAYIVANLLYSVFEFAETSRPTTVAVSAINSLGGGGVPINMEVSINGSTWFDYIATTSPQYQFTLDVARITITVV